MDILKDMQSIHPIDFVVIILAIVNCVFGPHFNVSPWISSVTSILDEVHKLLMYKLCHPFTCQKIFEEAHPL